MKNVLFLHSSSELYGSDRSLLNILKNLDRDKYKIFVILPCEGPLVEAIRQLGDVKIEIFQVAVLRRKNLSIKGGLEYIRDFRASKKYIEEYVRMNNIDIIDTNTSVVFPGAVVAKKENIYSVWHIREIIGNRYENLFISWMMNRYADTIVANSKSTGAALKVECSKIRVVYNAVDEIESVYVKTDKVPTIGMAGRINRWKGQKLFVDAAEIVVKERPDAQFLIAGDVYSGEEAIKKDLSDYIDQKSLSTNVKLLGQVNDMHDFYNRLDIFVLPSIQPEPFGLVVIEAMEHRLPVIATRHGGPMEIINDGEDGFLVDFNDAKEMAEKILILLNDETKKIKFGEQAFIDKRRRFSVKNMVNGIEQVFEENNKSNRS